MFYVTTDTMVFKFKFAYSPENIGNRQTICKIYMYDMANMEWAHISTGHALCSKEDNFSKATGRKIALSRALLPFDKNKRREFWRVYFNTVSKKRR